MSWLAASDPLALLALANGQITAPIEGGGAVGSSPLDTAQRSAVMGDPVPVVFGRRLNSAGGILISPLASEARFENDNTNAVTASYLLILSEGQMDGIQVRDVFQGPCRVGSFSQTYNRRAGTWTPGNYITQQGAYKLPECSYYCGSVGAYPSITTLSFQVTVGNENDFWRKQVHCFIRGGMWVTRLEDATLGPSNSYADLVLWLMQKTSRIPSTLIDGTAMTKADLFLRANGLTCNCLLSTSQNLPDLLSSWSRYFLLSESKVLGRRGLRPVLPINNDGTIKTTAIAPVYKFTESLLLPGSLEINYVNLSDRLPFVAQVLWRQEVESDIAIVRTAEVRYSGTAVNGPYEQHDLSAFCTSEAHAVKVGAYIVSRRQYVTHTCKFTAAPEAHATLVGLGDIVQLSFERAAAGYTASMASQFYQVERITKADTGDVTYECTHFPVNSSLQSLVALDVTAVQPTGILLSSNQSGVSCDLNSKNNTSVPLETYSAADSSVGTGLVSMAGGGVEAYGQQLFDLAGGGGGGGSDGLDESIASPHSIYPSGVPLAAGSGLLPFDGATGPCGQNGIDKITWYKNGVKVATVTLNNAGNVISRVVEAGQTVPGWLDSFLGIPGVLQIGIGDSGIYTSIVTCFNGSTHTKETVAQAVSSFVFDRYYWWRIGFDGSFGDWNPVGPSGGEVIFRSAVPNFFVPGGPILWPGTVTLRCSPLTQGGGGSGLFQFIIRNPATGSEYIFRQAPGVVYPTGIGPDTVTSPVVTYQFSSSFAQPSNSVTPDFTWPGYPQP